MLTRESEPSKARRRLIDAASEEFARHGFASARVRHIVDAAQVNLAAVNYYFGGKEGLYRATLAHLAGRAQTVGPVPNRRGRTPRERLQRRIYALLERFIGDEASATFGRILAHEAMNPTAHLEDVIAEALRPELERIAQAVREVAPPGAADEDVLYAALGVIGQCLLYQFAQPALRRIHPGLPKGAALCRRLSRHIADMTVAGAATLAPEAPQKVRQT